MSARLLLEIELLPNPEFGCGLRKAIIGKADILLCQFGGRWYLSVSHENHRHIIPEDNARELLQLVLEGPIGGKRSGFKRGEH